ncbi:hypothetical protein E0H75_07440 [Kribbella capetownensis]|uniref:DUF4386 family protein n=1 Tax=Kribbella capetownensis TaxID=1572659 RepID=A0A4R0K2J8_9ACTN|nr:hypothetical protein [Kribbella capetownensis]TCC53510.1 hypothetical protein E0H75_07440 [Kribbella capetownensis]
MPKLDASQTQQSSRASRAPLTRLAGPLAVAAGALMVVVEVVIFPIVDRDDRVGTSTNSVYRVSGVVYFVAFCLLVLAAVAAYSWQARTAGRFGVVGLFGALVGTMFLGGDLWFETFYVTYLADTAPQVLDADPAGLLVIGAVSSYLLFAIGWALFGLSSFRAGVFPRAICIAIVIGGLVGFQSLLPPFGIVLGLAMIWLGIWMIRTPGASEVVS